ncbi:uncharacterized protein N7511_003854 [Penicillium nucicola]|uniref:uncharacterized protein n=1 Tax=Penicillium nucicola TaxID=1850975 RepID=UPI002545A334|nr:uncharacterized protein N7511_003854 [Penicillium nucicola]KAJ5766238.1 hypothetical protein N7511_003854 [Penicillium nucicola]
MKIQTPFHSTALNALFAISALAVDSCAHVQALAQQVTGISVTSTSWVASNELVLSDSATGAALPNQYPFCRIKGHIRYSGNNSLGFELWLPEKESYNERYLVAAPNSKKNTTNFDWKGNGGLAGTIDTSTMLLNLNRGYAVAAGDSGHEVALNGNGTTAPGQYIPFLNNVAQTKAWIHDSIAMLTSPTRDLSALYYGSKPEFSYFSGCSTGGAQGFALAQLHPELFDGIYAGSPGNWYSHLILSFLWNAKHIKGDAFLNQSILNFTTNAILEKCDAIDGVVDGLIENPLECPFNIRSLACADILKTSSTNVTCLTQPQIKAMEAIYAGPADSRNGGVIFPGYSLGSEKEWLMQETSLYLNYSTPVLQNLVFDTLSFNVSQFDFGADVDMVDAIASPLIDSISTDLSAFRKRGGKMIVTQGWTDPFNVALWPIMHLEQLQNTTANEKVSDFFNLFMIPGGGHCGPATNFPSAPSTYHTDDALRAWVENGTFPHSILTSGPLDGSNRTRKICPWPQSAHLDTKNSSAGSDDAENFVCA